VVPGSADMDYPYIEGSAANMTAQAEALELAPAVSLPRLTPPTQGFCGTAWESRLS
jgi:hypothetical protein